VGKDLKKVILFIVGQLNINHKVLKEGTKNTENDRIKRLKNVTLFILLNAKQFRLCGII
jgi:hypothetical protein